MAPRAAPLFTATAPSRSIDSAKKQFASDRSKERLREAEVRWARASWDSVLDSADLPTFVVNLVYDVLTERLERRDGDECDETANHDVLDEITAASVLDEAHELLHHAISVRWSRVCWMAKLQRVDTRSPVLVARPEVHWTHRGAGLHGTYQRRMTEAPASLSSFPACLIASASR